MLNNSVSNDTVLKEGYLMEHLSLSDENKYSEYYFKVSYSCILYQHTTEGHSCLDLRPLPYLWSNLATKKCKCTFKCKLKIALEKHLHFCQRFTGVEENWKN